METNTMEEIEKLVARAKKGDEAAFSQLYQRFSAKVFRFIRLKISNREDAEDLSQTVFYKSYRGLKSLHPGKINFLGWLLKITSNTINDHFRKIYRSPFLVGLNEGFDPPDHKSLEKELMVQSDFELARKAFGGLPPLYKKILELRFILDRPLDEVAKQLNKTTTSVRIAQCRGLKKPRTILAQTYNAR